MAESRSKSRWLNRTVLAIGLTSLFSDWSHEIATAVLPAFLATLGVAAAWLGIIEGVSDGLASFTKLGSGYYTDKLERRKPIAVFGYTLTAFATASFGFATAAWNVLIARALAWFGRGLRQPVRKALLASAVTPETYGRAFGFERMMDTIGAIVGPASAFVLLPLLHHSYPHLFYLTLIPGLIAAALIAFGVKETKRLPVSHISFRERVRQLPQGFKRMLVGVGIFGSGAFAHSMLILLATQRLIPTEGAATAASIAVGLYLLHNVFYASFAFAGGWFADRIPKKWLLAGGYSLAGFMSLAIIVLPVSVWTLALIFILGGTNVGLEETLEDSLAAELVTTEHHGMAFGVLATVNGVGDFISSTVVGILWSAVSISVAFGYSALLSFAGALVIVLLPLHPKTARSR